MPMLCHAGSLVSEKKKQMSNRRRAKLEMAKKHKQKTKNQALQMIQGPVHSPLVLTHNKMFSIVFFHLDQLKYGLD